jgi:predicted protein tyrosine phosphatase
VDLEVSVTSVDEAELVVGLHWPHHLVSIWNTGAFVDIQRPWVLSMPSRLVIQFDDVLENKPLHGYIAPTEDDARKILEFAKGKAGRMLIHCAGGVSRSTASALGILAQAMGPNREQESVKLLKKSIEIGCNRGHRADDYIRPNMTLVEHFDKLLNRKGALVQAIAPESYWRRS